MTINIKSIEELSTEELYDLLKLRIKVFIVEQNCPYQDCDNKDKVATHMLCKSEQGIIIGYLRILPEGISYPGCSSIGRVVIHPQYRSQKIGLSLLKNAIDFCRKNWNLVPIKISAQAHLQKYYKKLDFIAEGPIYMEDEIPHRTMTLKL